MCGFVCFVNKKGSKNISISSNILKHRGPDYSGEIIYKSIAIRHWRLSIVDLSSKSNQPLTNENFIFAYNGELYNYESISQQYFNEKYCLIRFKRKCRQIISYKE